MALIVRERRVRTRALPPLGGDTPGLLLAALGVAAALAVHQAVPAVPKLTAAVVLGVAAAHLPGLRPVVRGVARPGLSTAGRRLMRIGIVLLGLKLGLGDVLGLGWATVAMVLAVVAATFAGTCWLGRRLGLPGDQPLLVATGYSICGASAIGAVSQAAGSDEEDVAASVALVTLCGTLAIAVLPLLQHPLGLDEAEFGRWVGAGVHDVGQVVATAQTGGAEALREAVLVDRRRRRLAGRPDRLPLDGTEAAPLDLQQRVRTGHGRAEEGRRVLRTTRPDGLPGLSPRPDPDRPRPLGPAPVPPLGRAVLMRRAGRSRRAAPPGGIRSTRCCCRRR
ncbi:YeiH family protein [Kitasatospora sp. NPDC001574]